MHNLVEFLVVRHAQEEFSAEHVDLTGYWAQERNRSLDGHVVDGNARQNDNCAHGHRHCRHVARGDDQEAANDQEDNRKHQVHLENKAINVYKKSLISPKYV